MLTNEPIRNHISMMVKNILITLVVVAFACISLLSEYPLYTAAGAVAVIVGSSVIYYIYWARTLITITDEEIIVERNTVFKTKKTIPYVKIASINADRDIVDRIFDTTKLKININSSRNAMVPEAVLTFGKTFAGEVHMELSKRIFDREFNKEELDSTQSVVKFTNKDVFLHGLVSLSTYQTLFTIALLAYSVVVVFFTEHSLVGVGIAIFMVVIMEVLPMFISIIRYYNFKVFRIGDTIHLQHGAIQNYHSSFEIGRVNAVRVKRTLFARLMGKAYIEAEVVGIGGGSDGETRPMISILSKESNIDIIMSQILPEFIYERKPEKQPKDAKIPILVNNSAIAITLLVIIAVAGYAILGFIKDADVDGMLYDVSLISLIAGATIIVLMAFVYIPLSMKTLEFDMGEDLFTFKIGIVDQETISMNYEKIQILSIRSGLPAKKRGLAKCRVSVLSAMGEQNISSGYFQETELEKISDIMLEKVNTRLQ